MKVLFNFLRKHAVFHLKYGPEWAQKSHFSKNPFWQWTPHLSPFGLRVAVNAIDPQNRFSKKARSGTFSPIFAHFRLHSGPKPLLVVSGISKYRKLLLFSPNWRQKRRFFHFCPFSGPHFYPFFRLLGRGMDFSRRFKRFFAFFLRLLVAQLLFFTPVSGPKPFTPLFTLFE